MPRSSAGRRLPLAGDPESLPVIDPGRNVDGHRLGRALEPSPPTLDAAVPHHPPPAATGRTGGGDHEDALVVGDLSPAAAGGTGRRLTPGLGPGAAALRAVDQPGDL